MAGERTVLVYGSYFWDCYNSQSVEVKKKIDWTVNLVRCLRMIPEKYFKHIERTKGLYEIRVEV